MLRTILLLIALLLVIGIALIYTGYIDIGRGSNGSVTIQTKDVEVGTKNVTMEVPAISVENQSNSQ